VSVSKDVKTGGWKETYHVAFLLDLLASYSSLSSASCGREQSFLMTGDQLLMDEGQLLIIVAVLLLLVSLSDMVL
jgi:hypothetical protein